MKIRIWGARGSIPSPLKPEEVEEKIYQAILELPAIDTRDPEAVRAYVKKLPALLRGTAGGNTSCVEIQAEGETFIIDAGSGLRELGLELMKGACGRGQGTLHIFFTHAHWDHIQGFPFFLPAFVAGNRIFIYSIHDLKTILADQQRPANFPIPLSSVRAELEFIPIQVGQPFSIGKVRINTILNAHPGKAYSYRFEDQHSVFVFASDSEYKHLNETSLQPHVGFFKNADALIFDAQYTLREAWLKIDWGHSSALIGVDLARAAGVKKLILFHHDPTYSDAQLQHIQSTAVAYQSHDTTRPACEVIIAYEGLTLDLTPPGAVGMQLAPDRKVAILTPTRIFDERGLEQLAQQIARLAVPNASSRFIIDLSQVETLSTASLQSLVSLRQGWRDPPIVLAAPSASVRQVIKLGGYLDFFAIYPSVEAAQAAIQAREALNLPSQMLKGRYQIENQLGAGRLGTVLKAADTRLNRTVAIKILTPSFSEATIDRFMRQARQLTDLEHRNIVKVFACDQDGEHTFLVEELVAGETLHERLANHSSVLLPADQALNIAQDIALALEYAHSRGVMHGDLTPQNVFLTAEGAKLSGWGLGRLGEGRSLLDAPLLYLAASHLAPEQVLGQALDARTDLYALGALLYQLFTGRLPFEGSDQEVLQAHLRQAPRRPRELNPNISPSTEHLILKLLAKNPNNRYASAQQARRISSSLLVSTGETIHQRRRALVGREQPLQALQARWVEARAGQGQLAFITGEQGIGKTSLAQQVATQTETSVALVGRCHEREGRPAYHPFADALRDYCATVPPEFFDEEARHLLGNLVRLVPEIRQALPDLPEPPALEPKQEQLRLMASLTYFIKQATQKRPWLLILDDLQWADEGSLELLRYLGHHLPSMALLIIGIYRDVELGRSHPLLEALRDLSNHPTYHLVPLGRLDQASVGQVLADIWQQSVPGALTEKIYQQTEGNPYYVEEAAKGLIDDGLVTWQEGAWRFPVLEEVRLPQSIHEAVWRRIGHLSPATQTVLHQAAVLGQTFNFDDLREMSGLSDWEALEHLDIAMERQLVQEAPGDGLLCFSHAEIQSVLYADLGLLRRRLLHRQAGEALERRAQSGLQRITEELAYHFGEAGEFERAIVYSAQAAQQAQATYANEAALVWHNQTVDMLERLGPEKASQFRALWQSTTISLGDVLALVGQYNKALEQYATAWTMIGAETGSGERARYLADLCYKAAHVYERRSEYKIALQWVEQGLSYLNSDAATIEAARLYLVGARVYVPQGRFEESAAWCQKSLAAAAQIKTREGQQVMAQGYYNLGRVCIRQGDLHRGAQFCRESVQVYQQLGDLAGQADAYNNLGIAYFHQGDWDEAIGTYHKSLDVKREIGDLHGQGTVMINLANIHLNRGEWVEAVKLYEHSYNIWKQIGATWGEGAALSNLAQVHLYLENWAEARAYLMRSQTIFTQIGSKDPLPELDRRWGEFYLKTGEPDQALTHLRRSIALAVEQGSRLDEGISRRALGLVHLARGERERAEAELRESLNILTDLHSDYEAAKTWLSLGRLAQGIGSTEEARMYLTRAVETFEKLGAHANLAEARELDGQLQQPSH